MGWFYPENYHLFQRTLDNLLCLKYLFDAGYDLKGAPGHYEDDYGNMGFEIFCHAVCLIFGTENVHFLEHENEVFEGEKFTVKSDLVKEYFLKEKDALRLFEPYEETRCDYYGMELLIQVNETCDGLNCEIHEIYGNYSNLVNAMICLVKDLKHSLMAIEERNETLWISEQSGLTA